MTVVYIDKRNILLALAALTGCFIFGILIGTFGISSSQESDNSESSNLRRGARYFRFTCFFIIVIYHLFRNGKSLSNNLESLFSETLESVDSDNIRSFLKTITSTPHLAASEQDNILTKWIFDKWTEFGVDNVNLERYDLLMSFPDRENPNKIYLKDDQGRVQFTSRHKEDVLRAEDGQR